MVNELKENFVFTMEGHIHYKYYKNINQNSNPKNLIFLHGLGASSTAWKRVADMFPDKYNLYFLDILGHGQSDAPIIKYNVETQAKMLGEFIKALHLSNTYIIGHSYGSWVALYYASSSKNIINGLVIVDAVGLDIYFKNITPLERIKSIDKMFYQIMKIDGNKDYVIKSILNSEYNKEWLTEEILAKITVPTLIIWGEMDKIIDPKYAEIFNKRIKNSKVKILKGAGHTPHYTNTKEFIDILSNFIDEN
ncbi:MAG: alpha/beta hydrolase [Candidatus Marsarchaeota archaeon]|jgi:pimeloyl-ACP methyl ester carboxylesterase|nr:alpha/beta hydrolase [Deltaproteobacteria bacterium]MCL5434053.1 alpha/beta hydrolase [Candidatus Marsarchaeota archaeon]